MRRLVKKLRSAKEGERGAAGVTVAVMMLVLIGAGAMAVDVGQIYTERAQLQNGADAGALAVARSCDPGPCAPSLAAPLANANSNDNSSNASVDLTAPGKVTVSTSTKTGSSSVLVKLFASALDAGPVTVGASATATWGGAPLTGPATLPMTFAPCQFDFSGKTVAMFSKGKNVNCAGDSSSSGKVIPGGFEFIKTINSKCTSQVYPPSATNEDTTLPFVKSGTGASMPSECSKGAMASYVGQVVLIPVFSGTSGTGDNAVYYIKGFAAFYLEGFKIGGSDCAGNYSLIASKCGGSENGIQGHFQKWVADPSLYTGGGYSEGGATLPPQLIK
ncbi:conserved hypothetical protein [Arthrobacter sp. 9AX]|uniref:pilus assembly protein TadG-related protein n=1 Tax=Arthrobacter sp. 9AX TaxID=2653131 RepID=UPI0012F3CF11|nr:TadE/TadG family type IV pilus assembly protein [Arthrobacter sp. 9AX]VXB65668.1 conserved hypothetical protein [Arthrobacter sp. 9AX]